MAATVKAHEIERYKVDSSNIESVGYQDGVMVVEFKNGHLYRYALDTEAFEAFARAESKGQYFNKQIRGKVSGEKLTGQCPNCGSAPEIIGETCSDCGVGTVRPIDTAHKER